MGASNALRIYNTWGRPVDGRPALSNRSLRLLVYMALISRDGDLEPWCGVGHTTLAVMALGLSMPDDPKKADAVKRKVRRFITPLRAAGAIRTERRATYGERGEQPARYRLYLDGPAPDLDDPEGLTMHKVIYMAALIAAFAVFFALAAEANVLLIYSISGR